MKKLANILWIIIGIIAVFFKVTIEWLPFWSIFLFLATGLNVVSMCYDGLQVNFPVILGLSMLIPTLFICVKTWFEFNDKLIKH